MDPNALIVQMLLDRQAEIVNLRAEVESLRAEVEATRVTTGEDNFKVGHPREDS